tara:strand:- start:63 stop:278 length:216 start_codon:yes stop_codon:yes gene_type:complete
MEPNNRLSLQQPVLDSNNYIDQSNRRKSIKCRLALLFMTTNISSLIIGYIFRGIYTLSIQKNDGDGSASSI